MQFLLPILLPISLDQGYTATLTHAMVAGSAVECAHYGIRGIFVHRKVFQDRGLAQEAVQRPIVFPCEVRENVCSD